MAHRSRTLARSPYFATEERPFYEHTLVPTGTSRTPSCRPQHRYLFPCGRPYTHILSYRRCYWSNFPTADNFDTRMANLGSESSTEEPPPILRGTKYSRLPSRFFMALPISTSLLAKCSSTIACYLRAALLWLLALLFFLADALRRRLAGSLAGSRSAGTKTPSRRPAELREGAQLGRGHR